MSLQASRRLVVSEVGARTQELAQEGAISWSLSLRAPPKARWEDTLLSLEVIVRWLFVELAIDI